MSHLKANPEAVCHAFEVIGEDIRSLIKGVIEEAGCTGIYYCVQSRGVSFYSRGVQENRNTG